jgi:hypothetical protein
MSAPQSIQLLQRVDGRPEEASFTAIILIFDVHRCPRLNRRKSSIPAPALPVAALR